MKIRRNVRRAMHHALKIAALATALLAPLAASAQTSPAHTAPAKSYKAPRTTFGHPFYSLFADYRIVVAQVERDYSFKRPATAG